MTFMPILDVTQEKIIRNTNDLRREFRHVKSSKEKIPELGSNINTEQAIKLLHSAAKIKQLKLPHNF